MEKKNKWLGFIGTLIVCALLILIRRYSFEPCSRCNTHWGVREYMVTSSLQNDSKVYYPYKIAPIQIPVKLCYNCAEKMNSEESRDKK